MTIYMVKIPKTSCSDYSEVITMRVETIFIVFDEHYDFFHSVRVLIAIIIIKLNKHTTMVRSFLEATADRFD